MEWSEVKRYAYYRDNGSFRNILSNGLSSNDWQKWIDFVNSNYKIVFKSYKNQSVKNQISFEDIKSYWEGIDEDGFMASLYIENVQINCFFNTSEYLYNDVDVFEINGIEQHKIVIEYMKNVSNLFDKRVYLERDFYEDEPRKLIEVYKNEINYNSSGSITD